MASFNEDALVTSAEVRKFYVKRILIDSRSSTNILLLEVFLGTGKSRDDLKKVDFPLIGFVGRTTYPLEQSRWSLAKGGRP